jgi:hypothetical protein
VRSLIRAGFQGFVNLAQGSLKSKLSAARAISAQRISLTTLPGAVKLALQSATAHRAMVMAQLQ